MEITEIKIHPVSEEKLRAYVTVTFDNCFVVRDLKIIQGNNRLFVAMPSRRMKDGSFRDVVHPSNSEMRELLEKSIFSKYEESLSSPDTTTETTETTEATDTTETTETTDTTDYDTEESPAETET